jgi:hypothetical protein
MPDAGRGGHHCLQLRRQLRATFRATLMPACIVAMLSGCGPTWTDVRTIPDPRETPEYQARLRSGHNPHFSDCPSIRFKPGRPRPGDGIHASVEDVGTIMPFLEECLMLTLRTDGIGLGLLGFADPHECTGNACEALSRRRLAMVRDILQRMHFPENEIWCSRALGSRFVLVDRDTTDAANRRVELPWLQSPDCPKELPHAFDDSAG